MCVRVSNIFILFLRVFDFFVIFFAISILLENKKNLYMEIGSGKSALRIRCLKNGEM